MYGETLTVKLRFGMDWELHVHLLKRKGPTHEGDIALSSLPGGLQSVITPRLIKPSEFLTARKKEQAVGLEPTASPTSVRAAQGAAAAPSNSLVVARAI